MRRKRWGESGTWFALREREGRHDLVFCPTDGDRYGTTRAYTAPTEARADGTFHSLLPGAASKTELILGELTAWRISSLFAFRF
jgi:hypothetical protein